MTARTQESPFRETAWDQRLDKMLDDLKTSVTPTGDRPSSRREDSLLSSFRPQHEDKPEQNFLEIFRSSSRSESRNSTRSGVEDGGLMKHHHKEYTSPDKSTRVVTDQFEYETQDPNKYHKKVMKSTYSNYKVSGDIASNLAELRQGPDPGLMAAARTISEATDCTKVVSASQKVANKLVDALSTIEPVHPYTSVSQSSSTNKTSKYEMTNGKNSYDHDLDAEIHEPMGGEVRKIVWRNRFEKTYEGNDGTPSITIEEEARRRNLKQQQYDKTTSTISSYHPQPPPISPGGQSWADPIPMPTPPQISPKGEPGVAYVYTYGQSGTQVQQTPPLNYITMPTGGTSIPPSEGAPSPTPSGTQPIIYHYSYHYTLQPGQPIPEGVPHPPGGLTSTQPTLQMAPTPAQNFPATSVTTKTGTSSSTTYDVHKRTENFLERNNLISTTTHHHTSDGAPSSPAQPKFPRGSYYDSTEPNKPAPRDDTPRFPSSDEHNRNISITINKTSNHVTHTKEYPGSGPATSTPFATPGRSRSSSPDRFPRGPGGSTTLGTVTHVTRTTNYSDSLDRLRRPPHESLPFPDTSPIKPSENSKIPKRVDDLMTSFSDSEDGPAHRFPDGPGNRNGPRSPPEREPLISTNVNVNSADASLSERKVEVKKEETKNVAGPPVYYPPGHNQLFDESMHTMTLKENKRRGMVKWRNEKASGYKESSSSSESKGGMAMVPVCLPLCCGAACAIM